MSCRAGCRLPGASPHSASSPAARGPARAWGVASPAVRLAAVWHRASTSRTGEGSGSAVDDSAGFSVSAVAPGQGCGAAVHPRSSIETVVCFKPFCRRSIPGSDRVRIPGLQGHQVGFQVICHLTVGSCGRVYRVFSPELRKFLSLRVTDVCLSGAQPNHFIWTQHPVILDPTNVEGVLDLVA
jgi:hypothetical protein